MSLEQLTTQELFRKRMKDSYNMTILDEVVSGNYLIALVEGSVPAMGIIRQIFLTRLDLDVDATTYEDQFRQTTFDKLDVATLRVFLNKFKEWSTTMNPFYFGSYNPDKTQKYFSILTKSFPNVPMEVTSTMYGDVILVK